MDGSYGTKVDNKKSLKFLFGKLEGTKPLVKYRRR